jgi:uncharacterized protein (DUF2384 family)
MFCFLLSLQKKSLDNSEIINIMGHHNRSNSNSIAQELGIDNKEKCEQLEKSFNLDADEGKDSRRLCLEYISELKNHDSDLFLKEFKSKLSALKKDIFRLGREERIEDIQNPDSTNPAKLIAALKWMVQKGIDDDIDILLDARDNLQLSQEAIQLLDYAVKCISDRAVRQQREEFVSKIERIKVPLESESNEIRDRRKQEIRDYAIEVFESENNAQQWLASSRQELGGLTPNDVIITEEGYETVKSMLSIIDYGVYA